MKLLSIETTVGYEFIKHRISWFPALNESFKVFKPRYQIIVPSEFQNFDGNLDGRLRKNRGDYAYDFDSKLTFFSNEILRIANQIDSSVILLHEFLAGEDFDYEFADRIELDSNVFYIFDAHKLTVVQFAEIAGSLHATESFFGFICTKRPSPSEAKLQGIICVFLDCFDGESELIMTLPV